jgi:putative peptidoglycan lipid II flippase
VGVGRTSLLLVPVALASRGAAFLVPLAVAAWFGVGAVTDAWFWALAFPTFALVLAGTALGTTATPPMAEIRERDPARLPEFIGGLLVWSGLFALTLGVVMCLLAPAYLVRFSEFDPETVDMAVTFLWELVPFAVLTASGAVLRVGCEVSGRFYGVAATPVIRAAVVLVVTWVALAVIGPHALALGLVAGELVQFLWWAWLLGQTGVRPRPTLVIDPAVRQVGRDLAPILGGEMLVAMNLIVDKGFAAMLSEGSVSTLEYADRARVIPQTLLQSSLAMVAFAAWSNLRAQGNLAQARGAVDQALRWTLALSTPVLAGMFIGRFVMTELMFQRGAFTPEDTLATASVLGWYLPGILPNLLGILAVRAHVVERNLSIIFRLGMVSVLCNAALNALLMDAMGLAGLALSTTLNMLVVPALYLRALRPYVRPDVHGWLIAGALSALSIATAVIVEVAFGAPTHLLDPVLWGAAVICLSLLGLGWRVTARPRSV